MRKYKFVTILALSVIVSAEYQEVFGSRVPPTSSSSSSSSISERRASFLQLAQIPTSAKITLDKGYIFADGKSVIPTDDLLSAAFADPRFQAEIERQRKILELERSNLSVVQTRILRSEEAIKLNHQEIQSKNSAARTKSHMQNKVKAQLFQSQLLTKEIQTLSYQLETLREKKEEKIQDLEQKRTQNLERYNILLQDLIKKRDEIFQEFWLYWESYSRNTYEGEPETLDNRFEIVCFDDEAQKASKIKRLDEQSKRRGTGVGIALCIHIEGIIKNAKSIRKW